MLREAYSIIYAGSRKPVLNVLGTKLSIFGSYYERVFEDSQLSAARVTRYLSVNAISLTAASAPPVVTTVISTPFGSGGSGGGALSPAQTVNVAQIPAIQTTLGTKADQTAVDAINANNATQTELDTLSTQMADTEVVVEPITRELDNSLTVTLQNTVTNVTRSVVIAAPTGSAHPDLATHDVLGLATDAELTSAVSTHASTPHITVTNQNDIVANVAKRHDALTLKVGSKGTLAGQELDLQFDAPATIDAAITGASTNAVENNAIFDANALINAAIANLRTLTGTLDPATNLGLFTGTTVTDNIDTKAAIQELEIALELLSAITGQMISPFASTYAAMPVVDASASPVSSGDTTILTADDIGTGTAGSPQYPKGFYVSDGTTWSYAAPLSDAFTIDTLTAIADADITDVDALAIYDDESATTKKATIDQLTKVFGRNIRKFSTFALANAALIKENELIVVGYDSNYAGLWLKYSPGEHVFATNDATNFTPIHLNDDKFDDAQAWESSLMLGYEIGNIVIYVGNDADDGVYQRTGAKVMPEPAIFDTTEWQYIKEPSAKILPNWEPSTAYTTADRLVEIAPSGVTNETAGNVYAITPTADLTSKSGMMDLTEWNKYTVISEYTSSGNVIRHASGGVYALSTSSLESSKEASIVEIPLGTTKSFKFLSAPGFLTLHDLTDSRVTRTDGTSSVDLDVIGPCQLIFTRTGNAGIVTVKHSDIAPTQSVPKTASITSPSATVAEQSLQVFDEFWRHGQVTLTAGKLLGAATPTDAEVIVIDAKTGIYQMRSTGAAPSVSFAEVDSYIFVSEVTQYTDVNYRAISIVGVGNQIGDFLEEQADNSLKALRDCEVHMGVTWQSGEGPGLKTGVWVQVKGSGTGSWFIADGSESNTPSGGVYLREASTTVALKVGQFIRGYCRVTNAGANTYAGNRQYRILIKEV